MRRAVLPFLLVCALMAAACAPVPRTDPPSRTAVASTTLPPMKSFAARAPRSDRISNGALVRDFLDLSFEMESGRTLPVLTRFEGPITLRVTGAPPPTLRADLSPLLARLRSEAGIRITTTTAETANITIETVSRRTVQRVLPQAACFVAPNVSSLAEFRRLRRAPQTDWTRLTRRERMVIVIPNDVSPQEVRDCLHEELAQALGPLNDLYQLPHSVFNDDNVHTVLTRFDMLILRATYAPELSSGMSRAEVAQRLPAVFARINPAGRFSAGPAPQPTPQAYVRAIQTALGPGASYAQRQRAAQKAVRIATNAGWSDNRSGFAYFALGRVLQAADATAANLAFQKSDAFYTRAGNLRLHRAYVATQLAAYALANADPAKARRLVTPYISVASDAQNAALLATLKLLRAESFKAEGRTAQANAELLDSLGWARYGFGADWAVQARMREIAALNGEPSPV